MKRELPESRIVSHLEQDGMVDPADSQFAVWLTPASSDRRWLSKIIQDYAEAYSAPTFEPHVTIYSGLCNERDDIPRILSTATGTLPSLDLEVTGLGYTENFFRTGFITFAPHKALTDLSKTIREQLQTPTDYQLEPHLSLVYKDLTLDQKRLAMLRIILSVQTITFDTLKVVKPSDQNWFDISSWREQSRIVLKG
jgi:putative hydrolase of the HAD superfamily